jgi:ABC-2 type transport system permease protein
VAGYLALYRAGFRRQATYRAALLTGLAANVFFGVIRSAVFIGLYRQADQVGGLSLSMTLTYVWFIQVVFGVVFASWLWEYPEAVRAGDFIVELLRPGDPFLRLLAADLGRSSFAMLARGLPQLLLPALFVDLALPRTAAGAAALLLSLGLCLVAGFEFRFVFGSLAFWTPDFRGWWTFLFGLVWLGGGFVVPVEYFPPLARAIAEHNPLSPLIVLPVRVATGRGVLAAVVEQLAWVAVTGAACWLLLRSAQRRVVVNGG